MKRLIALILVCTLLTGCTPQTNSDGIQEETTAPATSQPESSYSFTEEEPPEFSDLNDVNLLPYLEDSIYSELVTTLNSEDYFVENVNAIYISKEYLEEVAYNSQENIYFGYTLSELDSYFQGTRYVFTLGDDGQTVVTEFQKYDDTYDQILKNVAIGTGVILVCVTVSIVTYGAGAPAVSMIFAASAKTGTIMALSSGVFSGVSAGVVKGIETGDLNESMKAAALAGSEGFKWGAISGTIAGGSGEAIALKGATLNGLTMNEAALIQRESKLPLEFIKNFHSMDEYTVLKNAGLTLSKVNGRMALTQNIDWDFIGDIEDGRTNAQRVIDGLAPLDQSGKPYELHHIGQMSDSPLAILTNLQHKSNYSVLHANTGSTASNIDRNLFAKQRQDFWKALLEMSLKGDK
ncbi:HNH/ENDO VII family nuclease [Hominenteromicrobium sp.]|uniref:HNH/ENDO VII family nuclease n=1 Tax=Hominenteromicrobium sp. TaxID=3073581 RepID=UPI003A8EF645